MEAKELMIGDLVRVLPISRKVEAHNSKVGALTRNVDNTISIEGGYFPQWKGWSVGEEYIAPIPLTEEILKANGFVFDSVEDEYQLEGFPSVLIDYYSPCIYWQGHLLRFNYVHELQHALRLCGLNSLADNFKIS